MSRRRRGKRSPSPDGGYGDHADSDDNPGDGNSKAHRFSCTALVGGSLGTLWRWVKPKVDYKEDPDLNAEDREEIERQVASSRGEESQLTSLVLSGRGATKYPESLGSFPNLASLDISDNAISALPEDLPGSLPKLRNLMAQQNRLELLPTKIGSLRQLRVLDVSDNRIAVLPDSIGELVLLEVLNLNRNELTSLPEAVGGMTSLTQITMNHNRLTQIPASLCGCKSLVIIEACDNEVESLPDNISSLRHLRELSLAGNRLRGINRHIESLRSLRQLDVSDNELTEVPAHMARLGLEKMCFGGNDVRKIAGIGGMRSLRTLELKNNKKLKDLPEDLRDLPKLTYIDLRGTAVREVPEWLKRQGLNVDISRR